MGQERIPAEPHMLHFEVQSLLHWSQYIAVCQKGKI